MEQLYGRKQKQVNLILQLSKGLIDSMMKGLELNTIAEPLVNLFSNNGKIYESNKFPKNLRVLAWATT